MIEFFCELVQSLFFLYIIINKKFEVVNNFSLEINIVKCIPTYIYIYIYIRDIHTNNRIFNICINSPISKVYFID